MDGCLSRCRLPCVIEFELYWSKLGATIAMMSHQHGYSRSGSRQVGVQEV